MAQRVFHVPWCQIWGGCAPLSLLFFTVLEDLEVCLASYGMETHLGVCAYSACMKAGEGYASPAPAKQLG